MLIAEVTMEINNPNQSQPISGTGIDSPSEASGKWKPYLSDNIRPSQNPIADAGHDYDSRRECQRTQEWIAA